MVYATCKAHNAVPSRMASFTQKPSFNCVSIDEADLAEKFYLSYNTLPDPFLCNL